MHICILTLIISFINKVRALFAVKTFEVDQYEAEGQVNEAGDQVVYLQQHDKKQYAIKNGLSLFSIC